MTKHTCPSYQLNTFRFTGWGVDIYHDFHHLNSYILTIRHMYWYWGKPRQENPRQWWNICGQKWVKECNHRATQTDHCCDILSFRLNVVID
jgi:hypothetical protein